MKKLRLIVLLCLVCMVSVTVIACGETAGTSTETEPHESIESTAETTESTAESTSEEPAPPQFASMKIGDTPISEFTIVYARSEFYTYSRMNGHRETFDVLFPVYDFDRETAERLSDLIFNCTGIRLTVVEDRSMSAQEHEILIGETNRTRTLGLNVSSLTSDDYIIQNTNGKLAICGGEYGTTWHAIDYLESLFAQMLEESKTEFAFDANYAYSGQHHMVRIGCIGDSITEGVGSTDSSVYAYPAQLARFLWKDALVFNFGSSGATMSSGMNDAYTKRGVYTNALNSAADMDIFTIMLGTNDSNRERNWSTSLTNDFNNSCLAIVRSLYQKNDDLQFVLANCPAYFGSDGFGSAAIRNLQKQLVEKLNTAGYTTTFFDMFSVTKTMRSYYPDSLHPNNEGHMMMAEAFAKSLQELITPTEKVAE